MNGSGVRLGIEGRAPICGPRSNLRRPTEVLPGAPWNTINHVLYRIPSSKQRRRNNVNLLERSTCCRASVLRSCELIEHKHAPVWRVYAATRYRFQIERLATRIDPSSAILKMMSGVSDIPKSGDCREKPRSRVDGTSLDRKAAKRSQNVRNSVEREDERPGKTNGK
jgi:hypothetical protein